MKKTLWIIIGVIAAAALLAGAWFLGGDGESTAENPGSSASESAAPSSSASVSAAPSASPSASTVPAVSATSLVSPTVSASNVPSQPPEAPPAAPSVSSSASTKPSASVTPAVSATPAVSETPAVSGTPTASASSAVSASPNASPSPSGGETQTQCTLVIECIQVLEEMELLKPEKHDIIPAEGIFLPEQTVSFTEGDSVFDVLRRETKRNGISMTFSRAPLSGVYVEGIGNLNEFDCGGTSGWIYSVNGVRPSMSADDYKLKNGDVVRWYYSLYENTGNLE